MVGFLHETMATETILGMLALGPQKKNKNLGVWNADLFNHLRIEMQLVEFY